MAWERMKRNIGPYVTAALLVGGCLGTCSLIPKRKEPKVKAQVETMQIQGVLTRVYKNELNPGREYLDFYPFGDLDLILYDSKDGKYARSWYNRKADDSFVFPALEDDARQSGLIE